MKGKISALVILIAIFVIFLIYFTPIEETEKDKIAIIEIHGEIVSATARDEIVKLLDEAKRNESIKAVVLEIDCPGGEVSAIEDIYLSVLNLKKSKPIVAVILGMGASGGYFIATSADYIFALPTSNVGSTGVIAFVPRGEKIEENVIDTGRYKRTGYSEKDFPFKVQIVLNSFLDIVEKERGERLKLNRSELSKAMIYFGSEAVVYGLVDEIGSTFDAVEKAAQYSDIEDYDVIRLSSPILKRKVLSFHQLRELSSAPSFHYMYLVESINATENGGNKDTKPSYSSENVVLFDYSHKNEFIMDELNLLLSKIVEKGYSVRYSDNFTENIKNSKALVVISPKKNYNEDEIKAVKEFRKNDGRILLIFDTTKTNASTINTLANNFGIVFANGYLYNTQENYGNYRNIPVTEFNTSAIPDVKKAVFFTSTFIYGGESLASTPEHTYYSESDMADSFSVVIRTDNVVAAGDQTFLEQPYCYIEDNYRLVDWFADFLTGRVG
jgi:protease-4